MCLGCHCVAALTMCLLENGSSPPHYSGCAFTPGPVASAQSAAALQASPTLPQASLLPQMLQMALAATSNAATPMGELKLFLNAVASMVAESRHLLKSAHDSPMGKLLVDLLQQLSQLLGAACSRHSTTDEYLQSTAGCFAALASAVPRSKLQQSLERLLSTLITTTDPSTAGVDLVCGIVATQLAALEPYACRTTAPTTPRECVAAMRFVWGKTAAAAMASAFRLRVPGESDDESDTELSEEEEQDDDGDMAAVTSARLRRFATTKGVLKLVPAHVALVRQGFRLVTSTMVRNRRRGSWCLWWHYCCCCCWLVVKVANDV